MNRTLIALSAVCLPTLTVAAPPSIEPVDVIVTNPVVPVEVANAQPISVAMETEAVNEHLVVLVLNQYESFESIFVNEGSRPVLFTALSISAFEFGACSSAVPLAYGSFTATSDGFMQTPGSATLTAPSSAGIDRRDGNRCAWIVNFPGGLVVAPGQELKGYVEFVGRPDQANVLFEASGHRI